MNLRIGNLPCYTIGNRCWRETKGRSTLYVFTGLVHGSSTRSWTRMRKMTPVHGPWAERIARQCVFQHQTGCSLVDTTHEHGSSRWPVFMSNEMKCKNEMQSVERLHSTNSDQRHDNRLDGTGFTRFYLPPTRLSTNGMSHPAFIS